MSSALHRLFSRVFARSLVRELYVGILEREPDAEGWQAYTRKLRRSGKLAPIAAALATSREARDQALARSEPAALYALALQHNAEAFVHTAFEAVLARPPEPEALAQAASHLRETRDLTGLLQGIAQSEEARGRWQPEPVLVPVPEPVPASLEETAQARPEALVRATFQALLLRDPDPEALAAYSASLSESGDIQALLREVGFSREHREKLLRKAVRR